MVTSSLTKSSDLFAMNLSNLAVFAFPVASYLSSDVRGLSENFTFG